MAVIDLKSILYYDHSIFNHLQGMVNALRKNYLLSNNGDFYLQSLFLDIEIYKQLNHLEFLYNLLELGKCEPLRKYYIGIFPRLPG